VIVDPGHFHASLVQKEQYPAVSPQVAVYAPLSAELLDYLNRVLLFNTRADNPTRWELDVHASADSFERMLRDRPGNVVVFSGRNRGKIGRIARTIDAGFNVLADKPWIIASADLPKLAAALDEAEQKGLIAYDIMTERYEITSILQREIVNNAEVFGTMVPGSAETPAVKARSIHHLMKQVAGAPLRRPAWFFNIDECGEALADVGTHVVDLVQWTAFPDQQIDYRTGVRVLDAKRWPTPIRQDQFRQVTGEADFPQDLRPWVRNGQLDYYGNNSVHYTVRGMHIQLETLWNWEAPEGSGDVYEAAFQGTRARAEIRQGKQENYRPELYVAPNSPELRDDVFAALKKAVAGLQRRWPGLDVALGAGEARIVIPEQHRVSHEAHFAQVSNAFFGYLRDPKSLPVWEKSNMLVKYFVTTTGVELGRGR
jgi:predicted dehydrogenase